jgi:ATP-dependent helicase HrpB
MTSQKNSLPIDVLRADVTAALARHNQLVVQAPTGSGKSTRLPLWLREDLGKNVLVVVPRDMACHALATYLSSLEGLPVGQRIGYSVRFEEARCETTEILFVTPDVALRMTRELNLGGEFPFGAVLVDEFHERGWEVDLCSAILRHHLPDWGGSIVWTSATLDAEGLATTLGAHLMRSEGRTYPVDIEYMPQDIRTPSGTDLDKRVVKAVRQILSKKGDEGEILVFLPSRVEIKACESALASLARERNLELFQMHDNLPMSQMAAAFKLNKNGKRRVFLATHIAETSVTLPGVTWVLDSGLVQMEVHRAGRIALAIVPVSRAAMDQRAGRAGRVAAGRCVRLWDDRWPPAVITPPEIARTELDDVLLQAACCGLQGETFDKAPWVTQPPVFAVQRARGRMGRVGALDERWHITDRGRALAALPVSVMESRLMIEAPPALAATVADLVALMQLDGRLVLPVEKSATRMTLEREKVFEGCRNEVTEAIVAVRRGDVRTHGLHPGRLEEARKLSTALRAIIGVTANPQEDRSELPSDDALGLYMARCLPEAAFTMRPRAQTILWTEKMKPWGNGEVEVHVLPYEPYHDVDRLHANRFPPVGGIILQNTWTGEGKSVRGEGSFVLPCTLHTLGVAEVGKQEVGELRVSTDEESGQWEVQATLIRMLAGVEIARERRVLSGEPLREAVARLILEERLFQGILPKLRDGLHVWAALRDWSPRDVQPHWTLSQLPVPPDEKGWLISRLAALGLEESAELEMISMEDLLPDLSPSGLDEEEQRAMLTDFPRMWLYMGGIYECQLQPRLRRAWLEPIDETSKKAKLPPRELLPRFRGFSVMYRQASREVQLR